MKSLSRVLFLVVLILMCAAASFPAAATFACGKGICSCSGGDNCSDMRKSSACRDNLNCSAKDGKSFCTCTQKSPVAQGTPIEASPPEKKSLK